MDKITREFTVRRGEANVIYRFSTYPYIFTAKSKSPVVNAAFKYLQKVFIEGVPDVSNCKSVTQGNPLIIPTIKVQSDMIEHAIKADYRNCGRGQHHRVQQQMLKYDRHTVAIEVPVFNGELSGHIDILRIFPEHIEVADFKPLAHKERKAASQVFRYITLLAAAMELPISKFQGFYFDDRSCFQLEI